MDPMNDLSAIERPLPAERSFSKPYWDATREKKLVIQYDRDSQAWQFYPRPVSIRTGRADALEWREVSGKGEVFSFTVARITRPPFKGNEPFFLAMVTLDEGVNVMANVINCAPERMAIGLRLKPCWQPLSDGRNQLLFEPDDA